MGGNVPRRGRVMSAARRLQVVLGRHAVVSVVVAGIVGGIAGGGGAVAAMTVHDPTAFSKQIEQLNAALDHIDRLEKQLDQLKHLTSVQGIAGVAGYNAVNDVVQQVSRLGCRLSNFDAWDLSDTFDVPNLTSICAAANFVRYALAGEGQEDEETGELSMAQLQELASRRVLVTEEAALQGVAVGLSEREAGAEAAGELAALAAEAALTTNHREEAALNNRLNVRIIEELVALRSLMAASLEVEAAQALRSVSVNPVVRGGDVRREEGQGGGPGSPGVVADPFASIVE